ncbi:flavodoxin family protein [Christensenella intestinihominis]|uniref:flavodoxin family protein n=1 Tax=Christensenella intestinihominis TaxID=1851429 RepID=UPI00082D3773|nr:flavodoxin family protein [Christensenella intestinihominis]
MSTVILMGSPRVNGLSAKCAKELQKGFEQAGQDAKTINLYEKEIDLCDACGEGWGLCPQGKCIKKDDFMEVYRDIKRADILAVVSPVYWHDASEKMKSLLDRIRRCDLREGNHWLKGKKGIILAVAGGTGNGIIRCLEHLAYTLSLLEVEVKERLPITRYSQKYMFEILEEAAYLLATT